MNHDEAFLLATISTVWPILVVIGGWCKRKSIRKFIIEGLCRTQSIDEVNERIDVITMNMCDIENNLKDLNKKYN